MLLTRLGMPRLAFGALLLLLPSPLLTGCGGQTILAASKVRYPQAVAVYTLGCNTCHGDNLQGGIGPSLQHVGSRLTVAQIERRIETGGGPMPAYAAKGDRILTPAQIRAVSEWLAAQK